MCLRFSSNYITRDLPAMLEQPAVRVLFFCGFRANEARSGRGEGREERSTGRRAMSTGRNKHNLACLNKLNFGNKDCRNRSQILIKAQIQIKCYLQYRNNFNKNYTLFFRVLFICCYLAIKRSTLDLTKGSKCSQNVPCKCLNEASYF